MADFPFQSCTLHRVGIVSRGKKMFRYEGIKGLREDISLRSALCRKAQATVQEIRIICV